MFHLSLLPSGNGQRAPIAPVHFLSDLIYNLEVAVEAVTTRTPREKYKDLKPKCA